jgi:F-type H+-transporting ATPase subunit epsilon
VTTPLAIIAEADDVVHLRGEDQTGAFGILPGHADFLTALALSVVSWRNVEGAEHYLAVRGGTLEVRDGNSITIATREAVAGDDLHLLETEVLAAFRRRSEDERAARTDAQRLYLSAIREIYRFLKAERAPAVSGRPAPGPRAGRVADDSLDQ